MLWQYEDYVNYLKDKNPFIREWACEKLGELYRTKSLDLLKETLKDEEEYVRKVAEYYLDVDEGEKKLLLEKPKLDVEKATIEQSLKYIAKEKTKGKEVVIEHLAQRIDAIPQLIEFLKEDNDLLSEVSFEVLSKMGKPVLPYLKKVFKKRNRTQIIDGLDLLENLPFQESVEIIKENFNWLWKEHNEQLLAVIESLGSKEFIPLLKEELRPGEYLVERVYYLLCNINHIPDPILPELRLEIEKRYKVQKKKIDAITEKGKIEDLIEKTIHLKLECTNCGKSYNYEVSEVLVDTTDDKKKMGVYIQDTIMCKNCQLLDQYKITANAYLVIDSYLYSLAMVRKKNPNTDKKSAIKFGKFGVDGKEMSMKEGVDYYQKRIDKEPFNPELRVALGNILLRLKEYEESEKEYKMAINLNSNAVEAYASLSGIYARKGDYLKAYQFMQDCVKKMDQATFYRTADKASFESAVLHQLNFYYQEVKDRIKEPKVKVGRNDPCSCGSGKKYKKCCLLKEEMRDEMDVKKVEDEIHLKEIMRPDRNLQEKIVDYARELLYGEEKIKVFNLYCQQTGVKNDEESVLKDEEGTILFFDWFIFDYRLSENGKRVIEDFYLKKQSFLSAEEREILKMRKDATFSLYEVISVDEGKSVTLKDIFSEKEYEVFDITSSKSVVPRDLLATRIIPAGETQYLSGTGKIFPYSMKEEIKSYILSEYESYKKKSGNTDWQDFLHSNTLFLFHYQPKQEKFSFVTEEGDKVAWCKASFEVFNFEDAISKLAISDDFKEVDRKHDGDSLTEVQFDWSQKLSSDKVKKEPLEKGTIILSSQFFEDLSSIPDKKMVSLGTVIVSRKELILQTISEARLNQGKEKLLGFLHDKIKFKKISVKKMEDALLKREKEKVSEPEGLPPIFQERLHRQVMDKHFSQWINTPVPALNGQTPKSAAQSPEGRLKLEELLKEMENHEERKKKEGNPYYDISKVRKVLDI